MGQPLETPRSESSLAQGEGSEDLSGSGQRGGGLGATGLQLSGRPIREVVRAGQGATRLDVPAGGEARGRCGDSARVGG